MNNKLVEKINLLGPWVHGFFDLGNGIIIEDSDELQKKRLFAILGYLKDIIRTHYTDKKTKLVIGDVGCNTGFFIFELYKEFKFKKYFGFEPKLSNLKKAKFIRDYFSISKDTVSLKKYNLLSSPSKIDKMDVVLCVGVLHHIDDIYTACRNLHYLTNDLLVIECMVLPELLNNTEVEKHLELKDLVYADDKINSPYGIMGMKMESSFLDGATAKSGVVTIPTSSALCLILESVGFSDVKVEVDENSFHGKHYDEKSYRQLNAVFITARKTSKVGNKSLENKIESSTHRMQLKEVEIILPEEIITPLFEITVENKGVKEPVLKIIYKFQKNTYISPDDLKLLKNELSNDELSIVLGFRFQFSTKVKLEYAKYLINNRKYGESLEILNELIFTQNLDWRVCYRTYYLISKIKLEKKLFPEALKNVKKCLIAFECFSPAHKLKANILKVQQECSIDTKK
jgi:SAM-dependent methyltransferase